MSRQIIEKLKLKIALNVVDDIIMRKMMIIINDDNAESWNYFIKLKLQFVDLRFYNAKIYFLNLFKL